MMKFYKYLYVGESVTHPERVKRRLKRGSAQLQVYVLALAFGRDQLEIYHSGFLQQEYYKRCPPYIIGICNSYEEAVELVAKIAQEAVKQTGTADLKKYLFVKAQSGKHSKQDFPRFDDHKTREDG